MSPLVTGCTPASGFVTTEEFCHDSSTKRQYARCTGLSSIRGSKKQRIATAFLGYPCPDSNRGARFRKPLLYPPELQGRVRLPRTGSLSFYPNHWPNSRRRPENRGEPDGVRRAAGGRAT